MNDDLDLDTVLFGNSDFPADGSFDPFLPGLGQTGEEDTDEYGASDGHFRDSNPAATDDDGVGVIRYGRFGGESNSEYEPDDDGPFPWQGKGDIGILGAEERRAREGVDTGTRNIRRTAEERSGSSTAGTVGGTKAHSARVDSSIDSAAQRIRADLREPLDARERSAAVVKWEAGGDKNRKIKREYQKQGVTAVPQFHSTLFEAMLTGLKANTSGDWVITLVVKRDARQQVYSLDDAFGLALDVHVQRKRMRPTDDD